jgi:hypothetical protein
MVVLTGCASTAASHQDSSLQAELDQRAAALDAREAQLNARAETGNSSSSDASMSVAAGGDLLPPGAAPGECYARVWVDPTYSMSTEEVLVSEESTKISVIPARYETVTETLEVSGDSSRLETIPAVYGTESETIKVREGVRSWRVENNLKSAPASNALLSAAKTHGINLDAATPGMCFHEHYTPATYKTVADQVLKSAATESVAIIPAQYEMVGKSVLVKEASTRLVEVPAVYSSVEEQILDKPAHTIWKKGTGPIQKIDEATGEIMCLVEVPATYKTVRRTVLTTPASTTTEVIPAVYETVQVRQLVSAASEQRTPIEAVYGTLERQVVDQEGQFVWHEVANTEHPASTRTGNQICLTESEPQYKTVTSTVVTTPAQTRTIEIPAKFKDVQVTKLVSPASEDVTVIPARYQTIDKRSLVKDGYMAWRSILCETNMTRSRIADIQRALIGAGYDIGGAGADGVIGASTIQAVNAFQKANDLPVDKYLNIQTVKALGVSTK